jgi:hypothetical protein
MLHKLIFYFVFLVVVSGCHSHDDTTGDLTLRFQLTYAGKPLEMLKPYAYPSTGDSLFFTKLGFYISDLYVSSPDHVHFLKDIDYLDLSSAHVGSKAKDGYSYTFKDVMAADYNSIDFDIGVPAADNAKTPNDFSSESPLSKVAEYWSNWKSYIFFRPEGKIAKAGSSDINQNFSLHLGGNAALTSITLAKAMKVEGGKETVVDIKIDMAKFFSSISTHDIRTTLQVHSPNQEPIVVALGKNLGAAIQ